MVGLLVHHCSTTFTPQLLNEFFAIIAVVEGRSFPHYPLNGEISPVVEKNPSHINTTTIGRIVQRRTADVVPRVRIQAAVYYYSFYLIKIAVHSSPE